MNSVMETHDRLDLYPQLYHINEAAKAMAGLYVLDAVQGALECGTVHGGIAGISKAASKIISICMSEKQRQLTRYDFHAAKAAGEKHEQ